MQQLNIVESKPYVAINISPKNIRATANSLTLTVGFLDITSNVFIHLFRYKQQLIHSFLRIILIHKNIAQKHIT